MTTLPRYKRHAHDGAFLRKLKSEINTLDINDGYASRRTHIKGVVLIGLWLTLLGLAFLTTESFMYIVFMTLLGVLCLPIVLNIGHESIHGTLFRDKKYNHIGAEVFFLLGTSSYFWKLRHNSAHHAFPNVQDWDLDIEQSKVIRLSKHQPLEKKHRFQAYYMPVLFCFYTLIWFFHRDFRDIKRSRFGVKSVTQHPNFEIIKLFFAKVTHLVLILVLPILTGHSWAWALMGFLVFHISASVVTNFALISTHVGEEQVILSPDEEGNLSVSWIHHQLKCTADFATHNVLLFHFFGGFNHHVAHHLFPHISHEYYPLITPLIHRYSSEFGLPYISYDNLWQSSISHFKRLHNLSFEI